MHTESGAMPISWMLRSAFHAAAVLALVAAPAAAQQSFDAGGLVYGSVGGGFGDGTFVATGAGVGLRLTPHLGLDVELTHLSGAGSGMPTHGYGAFLSLSPPPRRIRPWRLSHRSRMDSTPGFRPSGSRTSAGP